ncbi:MAG: rRNA maturation RNase YbeY [Myxococcales bacterium]|nr:rRNA maturation RNase YbeY [Myxococcales bacterium]MDH3485854.1 rRNA maturation RNase YbeY [Myxococcales bacterium]
MPIRLRSSRLKRRSVRHPDLAWRAEAMLRALGREDAELSILLCDDATIRKLNRRYRQIDKATDVLAFPMGDGPESSVGPGLLGDVVISVPTATRQARRHDRPIIDEVTYLLAHGLLHLLGYDHGTASEEREMKGRTDVLMRAVRVGRPGAKPVGKLRRSGSRRG